MVRPGETSVLWSGWFMAFIQRAQSHQVNLTWKERMNSYLNICNDFNVNYLCLNGMEKKIKFLPLFMSFRYSSSPLPGKENLFRFWLTVAQPVFRKMSWAVLVQALTGIYLATKHHRIYVKILERMNTRRDPEELQA